MYMKMRICLVIPPASSDILRGDFAYLVSRLQRTSPLDHHDSGQLERLDALAFYLGITRSVLTLDEVDLTLPTSVVSQPSETIIGSKI